MCSHLRLLVFTVLLAASAFSLPASSPLPVLPTQDSVGTTANPVDLGGDVAQTSGCLSDGDNGNSGPGAEVKRRLIHDHLQSGNALFVIMMALQQQAEAGDASFVREHCNGMVAKLAPMANTTSCPWEYTCSYDQLLYPSFVVSARCLGVHAPCISCSSEDCTASVPKYCQRVESNVYQLVRASPEDTWPMTCEGGGASCNVTMSRLATSCGCRL